MTIERAFVIGVEPTTEVSALIDDIRSAKERARKAEPGDRSDVIRFEFLYAQLEQLAVTSANAPRAEVSIEAAERSAILGGDDTYWGEETPAEVRDAAASLVQQGCVPVLVVDPLTPSATHESHVSAVEIPPPAEPWQDPDGYSGRKAVESRFRAQIREALDAHTSGTRPRSIAPSGVQNAVVTEILREFVTTAPDTSRVDVPIEYRDGSRSAQPFALRSLELRTQLAGAELDLRFALLSIRHTEMDAVVHGAWLRNAEVSRPMPAAQTDDLVYEISRTQLLELTSGGSRRVRIHLYQTGLETAVVGFYKAVVDHLLEFKGTVAVQPMYFQNSPQPRKNNRPGKNHTKGAPVERESTGR
jgi:hypothetical protein